MSYNGICSWNSDAYLKDSVTQGIKSIQDATFPILALIGDADTPTSQPVHTFYDDYYMYESATLASGYTAASDTTMTVSTGQGKRFRPGMTFQAGTTGVFYKVVSIAGDVLTVGSAAFYGTKANLSSATVLYIITGADIEAVVPDTNLVLRTEIPRTTHLQDIEIPINVSDVQNSSIKDIGVSQYAKSRTRAINAALAFYEGAVVMGYGSAEKGTTPSGTVRRYMSGLYTTISNTVSAGSFSSATFGGAFSTLLEKGCNPLRKVLLVNPSFYNDIAGEYSSQFQSPASSQYASISVNRITTAIGDLEIIPCGRLRIPKTAILVDLDRVNLTHLQNEHWHEIKYAKTARAADGAIAGTVGLEIAGRDLSHAVITWT